MKTLCLILLFHASLQLQCDKTKITAHIGDEFRLSCRYADEFRYAKKYWCRGESRSSCVVVAHSEGSAANKDTHRSRVVDAGRRGLSIQVTNLQRDDAGLYWVGIDKMYADIMLRVRVVVTEVPVSKPTLWPLSSLMDRPSCFGEPERVRCGGTEGSGVHYAWYEERTQEYFLLHNSSDLHVHCDFVKKDRRYRCTAWNGISSQTSDVLSVQRRKPQAGGCSYVVRVNGQAIYECGDGTTTVKTLTTTFEASKEVDPESRNQSQFINQTHASVNSSWTRIPLWYSSMRWSGFAALLVALCLVRKCKKKHKRRKKTCQEYRGGLGQQAK